MGRGDPNPLYSMPIGSTVNFAPWTVGPRGNYWARCTTALTNDTNARNDTLSSQFEIQVHDVGTNAILAPRGVVPLSSSITPQAIVYNFGTETETFDVSLVVLTIPPSTWTATSITLNSNETDTVSFPPPPWLATPLGVYEVRCSTSLARDSVYANNLKIDTVIISNDDVGVTAIIYPTGTLDSTASMTPQATVFNYGSNVATFPVIFSIFGPVNYTDTQNVIALAPNTGTTVNFTPWIVGPRGNYITRCSTAFAIDTNTTNDTLSGSFTIIVHDVGTNAILAPTGVVSLNSSITPSAIVQNYGTGSETFDVSLVVLTVPLTTWNQSVTLNSGEIDTINFAPPWLATPIGNYEVRCSTSLASDSVPINNLKIDSVKVVNFDVELISINYPVGYVDSTATLIPSATVRNYATVPVNFPAIFRIAGAVNWADTQMINLNASQTTTINFNPWTVGPRGGYTTRCTTGLFGDLNPNNNHKDSIFRIRGSCGDVGLTLLILNPPGSNVDSGTVITITARVRNFGTEVADFQVKTKISTYYNESLPVVGLIPGDSLTLDFPNSNALQRGSHIVRCSTALTRDVELTNDRLTRNISVIDRDVGPLSITYPVGNIDSTANPITPQAVIRNGGNTLIDSFPVIFTITGPVSWTDIQMVRNLPASAQRAVSFTPLLISLDLRRASRHGI